MEHPDEQVQAAVRIAIISALFRTEFQRRKFGPYQILATPRPERRCIWNVSRGVKTIAFGVWQEDEARQ